MCLRGDVEPELRRRVTGVCADEKKKFVITKVVQTRGENGWSEIGGKGNERRGELT